ncbi:MAG TPA: transcription antitermination factor NusB [Saprospiraceae bacterium]|jgi:N utilization substance protein B|nr:transcription antitermination factor NusB [Saprospiraceae bacterium]
MLSRRNVRVKVMQRLYSLSQDKDLTFDQALKAFHESIEDTFNLYLLNLYCIQKICAFSSEDLKHRMTKHIKTDEDKNFTDKLFTNDLIQSLIKNKGLQDKFKKQGFDKIEDDVLRKVYKDFIKEEAHQKYILSPENSNEDTVELLLELYRVCRKSEVFNEVMDDRYAIWTDDKSLVIGTLKKSLKSLPTDGAFYMEHYPDDDTVMNFGEFLFKTVVKENNELEKMIEPVLENWESERVALVDMILIKMALIELINFKTIPCKVTLNEYVELSKTYSTDKSKEFVNGVLDKLMKDLQDKNIIEKEGRGLLDE